MGVSNKKKLEQFVVNNRNLESLEEQISSFNFFEAIGAVRQELRHSEFLSFILNPSRKHGFSDLILKKILKEISFKNNITELNAIDIDVMNFDNLDVRREWRNIDLLIIDYEKRLVIAFENKIDSKEGKDQLKTYTKRLNQKFPKESFKHLKIYLTPDGEAPTHDEWVKYSYKELAIVIQRVIESRKTFLSDEIITLLKHYNEMLRRHIVEDSEIIELCRKIYQQHQDALDLIFEHRPDIQLEISEYLKSKVEQHKELTLDDSSKNYVRFSIKNWDSYKTQKSGNGWTSTNKLVLFQFKLKYFPKNLSLHLIIGPSGNNNYRESIFQEIAKNHRDLFGKQGSLTDKWKQVYKDNIVDEKTLSDGNFDEIKNKIDYYFKKDLVPNLNKIEPVITNVFKKLDMH